MALPDGMDILDMRHRMGALGSSQIGARLPWDPEPRSEEAGFQEGNIQLACHATMQANPGRSKLGDEGGPKGLREPNETQDGSFPTEMLFSVIGTIRLQSTWTTTGA